MRMKAAGPAVLVVVVVLAVGGFTVQRWVLDDEPSCAALSVRVQDLDSFDWDNGITSSGSEWISVLTTGATDADGPSRIAIATAVADDGAGFDRFRSALPADLQPAATRLRAVAIDPDSDRDTAAVERDVTALTRYGVTTCNLAP